MKIIDMRPFIIERLGFLASENNTIQELIRLYHNLNRVRQSRHTPA